MASDVSFPVEAKTVSKPDVAAKKPESAPISAPRPRKPKPTPTTRSASPGTRKNAPVKKVSSEKKSAGKRVSTAKAAPAKKAASASAVPKKKSLTPAEMKKREKKRFDLAKGLLITCVCLVFVTIITVSASTVAFSLINDVFVIDRSQNRNVTVEIPEGADYEQVFQILEDNGLIRQSFLTDFFCKFRHYDKVKVKDRETGEYVDKKIEYQPGVYYLEQNAGIEKILETIMVKSNVSKDTVRLTFPEGWSVAQIFAKIEKYDVCSAEKLYANLDIIGEQYDFISDISATSGRYLKAEGYLFPDTYDFYIDESPSSVLKKLFNNFQNKWTDEFDKRAKELGLTVDQVINLAAMIQREAKDGTQMGVVSSVMHNRLADSDTYPYFEMNSTKDYITSLKDYNLFSDFYYETYLSSYNTYSSQGLPPGPICNPGLTAIKAALYPTDTDYYFFCHSNSGEIYLAKTADEHQANTEKVIYGDFGDE